MTFEEGLVIELNSISGLSSKVYPAIGGEKVTAPHLIYIQNASGDGRLEDLQGHEGLIEVEYQLDVYNSTYSSLKTLLALVISEIKTFQFTNIGISGPYIQHCKILEDFTVYDEAVNLYRGVVVFTATYSE